jgi:hypothetical protein
MVAAIVGEGGFGRRGSAGQRRARADVRARGLFGDLARRLRLDLWRTAEKAPQAAEAMKMTAQDLAELGVIDRIVDEPAVARIAIPQRPPGRSAKRSERSSMHSPARTGKQLRRLREDRFLAMGEPGKGCKRKGLTGTREAKGGFLEGKNRRSQPPHISAPVRSRSFEMSFNCLIRKRKLALAGVAAVALISVPTQAQQAGRPFTQQEAQQGAQYHQQFLDEFGGAMTGSQAAYVEQVGKNIAVQSGLANSQSAFTVTLLNSSVDNAFAVPGWLCLRDPPAGSR